MISTIIFIALLFIVVSWVRPKSQHGQLPPGPKGLPILGNVFQIPSFQFLRFTEWKAEFGPIFSLNVAGQPVIVINSIKVAGDLLEKRSGIYSDRPRFIVGGELLTDQGFLPLIQYGDVWRKQRRAAQDGLRSQVVPRYQPAQELEAVMLVESMIKDPESWIEEVRRSTSSSMKTAFYGTPPIASNDDPVVTSIIDMGHRLSRSIERGRYFVEFFPQMLYLPTWLAPWKREATKYRDQDTKTLEDLVKLVKEDVDTGTYKPSLTAELYLNNDRHGLTHKEEAWIAGTMFIAGADTSSSAFRYCVLAMRLYPDVMRKAQAELDRVVGRERPPGFSDKEDLPYINALIKEVLRWGPVAPLGVPRQTREDDHYEGYLIPKGTLVLLNVWGMNNDPDIYPDPHEFRPERFLDGNGAVDINAVPGTRNQGHVAFGFGRRICIGMNLAHQFLFINIATLLWAANIEPAYDIDGNILTPTNSPSNWVDEGAVVRPGAFPCCIVPRFSGVEEILSRTKKERSSE